MIKLFTEEEFENGAYYTLLKLECESCHNTFERPKSVVKASILDKSGRHTTQYCSSNCKIEAQKTSIKVNCKHCNKEFLKTPYRLKKFPNSFCSSSCSALFSHKNKMFKRKSNEGYGRSRLELYLQNKLSEIFPQLNIEYCGKTAINSEIDIYIPSLKLAFELNGIFHYEPIYGAEKLSQIQNNGNRKFQACLEKGIELCIINVSKQKSFKEKTAEPFLQIILKIINDKLNLLSNGNHEDFCI